MEMGRSFFHKSALICVLSMLTLFILFGDTGWAQTASVPKSIAIATTSVGSAPYVVSVGISELLTKKAGISSTAEAAGGADAITRLVKTGSAQLGLINSFAAEHAYKGDLQFAKEGKTPVRALIWGNDSLRQPVVRKASGIKTIADFRGKKIMANRTVGEDTEIVLDAMLKVYNLKEQDMKILTYSRPKEIMDGLTAGTIDGAIWPASAPNPLILQLQESVDLAYPSIPKDKWEALLKDCGSAFFMSAVKPNTYKNQPEEVYVPAIQMGLSTLKDFPEEAAYRIAKTLFSNYEELKTFHPSAADWNLKITLQQFCVPFHAGAVKYFKEVGAWTSEMEKKQQEILALEGK